MSQSRYLLVAALVALLVAAAAGSPSRVVAAPEGDTITTVLYPGWNMVGWVGPSTSTSELFDAIPALRQVSGWDADAQSYRRAVRNRYGALPTLTAGMGMWLFIGGDSIVEWHRVTSNESVLLVLRAGRNLIGWAGEGHLTVGEAAAQFGDGFVRALGWDAATQRYVRYRSGTADDLMTQTPGSALWIELTTDLSWWQSGADFVFGEELTSERRSAIRAELDRAVAFFAEQYGLLPPRLSLFSGDAYATSAARGTSQGRVTSSLYVASHVPAEDLGATVAREYFGILSEHIGGGFYSPAWIREGAATYASGVYVAFTGRDPDSQARSDWLEGSERTYRSLNDFEDSATLRAEDGSVELGALGIDWLVRRAAALSSAASGRPLLEAPSLEAQATRDSYIVYYRSLWSSGEWREAFAAAFGISARDFYDDFERYRVGAALDHQFGTSLHTPPEELDAYRSAVTTLPHPTDDAVRPTFTFFGDVPQSTRRAAEAALGNVYTLLTERFGAQPYEYSVLFSADEASAVPVRLALHGRGYGRTYHCLFRGGGILFYVMTCEGDLRTRDHIQMSIEQLLSGTDYVHHALWLSLGVYEYAVAMYGAHYWLQDIEDDVRHNAELASTYDVSLTQLETHENWQESDNTRNWALSFLAMHLLAGHAGEQALTEYYRLLPRGNPRWGNYEPGAGSWQAAFEQAFGLTVEDFYEQFEAYRATLTAE